ncbi:hypothetical protein WN867_03560 [Tetragenococcus halophilus]|uniref:hypothetical protein n=1 Tax=Tetragenococcus halophilus TaxID=51669 RepID=UPI0030C99B59
MKVKTDDIGRIHLIDNSEPYGSIIFDIYSDDQVVFYQDSNDQDIRTAFENIDEGVELDRYELIDGLKQVIQKLEEI